jgi:hypothetical protein
MDELSKKILTKAGGVYDLLAPVGAEFEKELNTKKDKYIYCLLMTVFRNSFSCFKLIDLDLAKSCYPLVRTNIDAFYNICLIQFYNDGVDSFELTYLKKEKARLHDIRQAVARGDVIIRIDKSIERLKVAISELTSRGIKEHSKINIAKDTEIDFSYDSYRKFSSYVHADVKCLFDSHLEVADGERPFVFSKIMKSKDLFELVDEIIIITINSFNRCCLHFGYKEHPVLVHARNVWLDFVKENEFI